MISAAIDVVRLTTGEEKEAEGRTISSAAPQLGNKGGKARATNMIAEQRSKITEQAAKIMVEIYLTQAGLIGNRLASV